MPRRAEPAGAARAPEAVLQVQGLGFAYPGQPALFDAWSVTLHAGLHGLEGERGKSTLLRLLAGELRGTGRLMLAGVRIDDDPAAWRRKVCWIDPRDPAWQAMRPDELLAAQQALHPGLDVAAWQRHLAGFELSAHLAKPMYALSTGSQRKLTLALALAARCPLTLLDEPTAGLDRPARDWLVQALTEAAGEPGRAFLLASAWGLEGQLPWAGSVQL